MIQVLDLDEAIIKIAAKGSVEELRELKRKAEVEGFPERDIHARDRDGNTALAVAAKKGNIEVVTELLLNPKITIADCEAAAELAELKVLDKLEPKFFSRASARKERITSIEDKIIPLLDRKIEVLEKLASQVGKEEGVSGSAAAVLDAVVGGVVGGDEVMTVNPIFIASGMKDGRAVDRVSKDGMVHVINPLAALGDDVDARPATSVTGAKAIAVSEVERGQARK
jgi:ankyrin repeat protein